MTGFNDFLIRLTVDPKWQYRAILAVGIPISVYLFAVGSIPLVELLESVAVITLFPVLIHRFIRSLPLAPGRDWTSEQRLDHLSSRLHLDEHHESTPGARIHAGDFLDDPARLEVYLPPSFELVETDDGSEVWRSDELKAVLRRDSLRIELHSTEDEEAFETLAATVTRRRLLE